MALTNFERMGIIPQNSISEQQSLKDKEQKHDQQSGKSKKSKKTRNHRWKKTKKPKTSVSRMENISNISENNESGIKNEKIDTSPMKTGKHKVEKRTYVMM